MKDLLTHPRTIRLCQIATALVLGLAGLAKIGDMGSFAEQVHNFRVVPVPLENLLAMTIPWIELVAAMALVVGLRVRGAAMLGLGLLLVFTMAVAAALVRGLDIECGCFGTADASRVGVVKIAQNLGFVALAAVATLRARETR